jgi:endonuclease/exonuclease/phosphatase family metal-dependent hydrolase
VLVHVFTTHLQAANGSDDEKYSTVRSAQLAQLADFMRRKITTTDGLRYPAVLAGDFNIDALAGTEYAHMMSTLSEGIPGIIRDLLLEANNNTQVVTSAGGLDGLSQKNGVGERLDYAFYLSSSANIPSDAPPSFLIPSSPSAALKVFKVAAKIPAQPFQTVSDHFGVEAFFSWQ